MDQNKIGKFILEQRKNKNLTQEQLAEILGVNNRTISRWENGKNMPDISLFKLLCETLEISVEELINGEKTNPSFMTSSYEKAIMKTIKSNEKTKKKLHKLTKILLLIIILIISIYTSIIIYYKSRYPKIDIYNIKTIQSEKNKLNKNLTLDINNYKIYFYGIDSLQLEDSKNNYFDLKIALKYKQTSIKKIKNYLEKQYKNDTIEKYIVDNNITIYKTNKYEAIICSTKENKDIYFGTKNLSTNLKGNFCGKENNNLLTFTKTYYILNIEEDDDYNFINVALKEFQGQTAMVRINRTNIKEGKSYEFTFTTYEIFDNTINNIFENSNLIEVKETNKVGLEQINDKIYRNNY